MSGATAAGGSPTEAGTEGGGAGGRAGPPGLKGHGDVCGFCPKYTEQPRGQQDPLVFTGTCPVAVWTLGQDMRKGWGFPGGLSGPADRGWGLSPGWRDEGLTIIGERHSNLCSQLNVQKGSSS